MFLLFVARMSPLLVAPVVSMEVTDSAALLEGRPCLNGIGGMTEAGREFASHDKSCPVVDEEALLDLPSGEDFRIEMWKNILRIIPYFLILFETFW